MSLIRRYPGGIPFTRDMKSLFFGRKEDTKRLHRLCSLEPLVVMYGKSGLGKSSLINADLIPELEENPANVPLLFRFSAWTENSTSSPMELTIKRLSDLETESDTLDRLAPEDQSLWKMVKAYQFAQPDKRLILIFDQFEELFSYPKKEVKAFKKQIAELLRNRLPHKYEQILDIMTEVDDSFLSQEEEDHLYAPIHVRILFIIRSDKMNLLDQLSDYLPSILKNNHELSALSEKGAMDALIEPARIQEGKFFSQAFEYGEEAKKRIMDFLKDPITGRVEAIQLQILCTSFEDKIAENNWSAITEERIGDLKEIVDNYYHDKLGKIKSDERRAQAAKLIEDGLVDKNREQRLTLHESQIYDLFEADPDLLETLIDCHLLRRELAPNGGYNYELSHDTLIGPALSAKQKRLELERLEQEIRFGKEKEEELRIEHKKRMRARSYVIGIGIAAILMAGVSIYAINQSKLAQNNLLKYKTERIERLIRDANTYMTAEEWDLAKEKLKEADELDDANSKSKIAELIKKIREEQNQQADPLAK